MYTLIYPTRLQITVLLYGKLLYVLYFTCSSDRKILLVVEIVDALDGIEINVASKDELTELNRVIRDYGLEQGKEFSPVEKTGLQTLDGVHKWNVYSV